MGELAHQYRCFERRRWTTDWEEGVGEWTGRATGIRCTHACMLSESCRFRRSKKESFLPEHGIGVREQNYDRHATRGASMGRTAARRHGWVKFDRNPVSFVYDGAEIAARNEHIPAQQPVLELTSRAQPSAVPASMAEATAAAAASSRGRGIPSAIGNK